MGYLFRVSAHRQQRVKRQQFSLGYIEWQQSNVTWSLRMKLLLHVESRPLVDAFGLTKPMRPILLRGLSAEIGVFEAEFSR